LIRNAFRTGKCKGNEGEEIPGGELREKGRQFKTTGLSREAEVVSTCAPNGQDKKKEVVLKGGVRIGDGVSKESLTECV